MDSLAGRLGINLLKKAKQDPRTMDALLGAISYQTMPIVRRIIPELVAAVKERGEEALYQR